jgi:hypothetical protein
VRNALILCWGFDRGQRPSGLGTCNVYQICSTFLLKRSVPVIRGIATLLDLRASYEILATRSVGGEGSRSRCQVWQIPKFWSTDEACQSGGDRRLPLRSFRKQSGTCLLIPNTGFRPLSSGDFRVAGGAIPRATVFVLEVTFRLSSSFSTIARIGSSVFCSVSSIGLKRRITFYEWRIKRGTSTAFVRQVYEAAKQSALANIGTMERSGPSRSHVQDARRRSSPKLSV